MRFIPLQKWDEIILCYSNRKAQTLMVSLLSRRVIYDKFEGPSCYGNRVAYSFHFCNGMKRIPCSAMV